MERVWALLRTADGRNVAVLVLVVLLLWIPRFQGPIDLRWDAGVYYVLGTSLAEGRGYRLLNEPGEIEAVQYPPLLPAVVAAVQRAVGTSDSMRAGHALRLLFFVLALAYAGASYVLARRFLPPPLAMLASGLTTLHNYTVFLSDLCFSEIPYALVTVLFLLALRSGERMGTVVLGGTAFLLRTSGLALLGAWVGESLVRRRPGQALLRAALALVPVLLWQGYVAHVVRSPDYQHPAYAYQRAPYQYYNVGYAENLRLVDPFRPEEGRLSAASFARRVLRNVVRMPVRWGDAVSVAPVNGGHAAALGLAEKPPPAALLFLPRAALGLTVLAGLVWLARRGEWFIPLFVAGSSALVCATPWPLQLPRYLAPLTPLLAVALAGATGWLRARGSWFGPIVRSGMTGLLVLAVVMQLVALVVLYSFNLQVADQTDRSGSRARGRLFYYDPAWRSFDESLDWLDRSVEASAVVATSAPHRVFLRTDRRAVMPPMKADAAEAQRLLDSAAVDYLIIDDLGFVDVSRRYGEPTVKAYPALWELVYDRGARVYRRLAPEHAP